MSDEFGRVRCAFCLELGAVCRARRRARSWERCCSLCQCGKHATEPPPAPAPWVELGPGGAPIHPKKCSPTVLCASVDANGKRCGALGCMYCAALEVYRSAMRKRAKGVLDASGEAAPA